MPGQDSVNGASEGVAPPRGTPERRRRHAIVMLVGDHAASRTIYHHLVGSGFRVERVIVDDLWNETFYAKISVVKVGQRCLKRWPQFRAWQRGSLPESVAALLQGSQFGIHGWQPARVGHEGYPASGKRDRMIFSATSVIRRP